MLCNCELLQDYQTRTVTEMNPHSSCSTFSPLKLNTYKGLLDYNMLLFLLLRLQLMLISSLCKRCDYKQMKHGNWKNNWTFSLAGNGGCQRQGCLGGDEGQVGRGGRRFRAGGRFGGVRIAGCGWVSQCHVSSLAPLASRLE